MVLIVDRTDDRPEPINKQEGTTLDADPQRRRIDVTDLHAAGIEEFVESSVDTDDVSLEHRLDRTYLVIEE
ncbi:hypothetical protein Htur_2841 [Haloterrigena turkmenica DSM 5511]|uniref:Uncharacterized protein n=1 Tax=Haloterrigena turkmenica (strain ATCC 51198 / DSM 5511 / JCM 9101 / NCIMB 13204 / VKM B-1734 / 4k) TaxID=543526 RepID=D2RXI8_HALTV|nr:hypothetical protein [Haloterrigena turkmenica]ADB61712.1 hypothetical protein Htur_2841 [Haloterrigena turkmenica DSM 5511]